MIPVVVGLLESSTAVKVPEFVPMLTLVVVPCPDAFMAPVAALLVTDMPEIEPADIVPELVPMIALLMAPWVFPAVSVAWSRPPAAIDVMFALVMEPLLTVSEPDRVAIVTATVSASPPLLMFSDWILL